ncbi:uncharacterized protein STEHIDRAFT_155867 [Stereum hirsutum FP-91666 SS1]|uniref:uncharacterized protein n=1 Tax=Stereum hirsutum (strain FP-91666) TaxID=721885 RepID=UPI000440ADCA|nr:uncharacterized protein STEHIDRAFT_155867 [Stereum hirsutum FP-91666 SS1]EIM88511.1 hypothetical protein STEHIDRAFT_155867 [Stereum hirsutum FP-91666 SS1]
MVYIHPIFLASPFTLFGTRKPDNFYADVPSTSATATSFLDILTPDAPASFMNHLLHDAHLESSALSALQLRSEVETVSLLSRAHVSFSHVPTSASLAGLGISFESMSSPHLASLDSSTRSPEALGSSFLSLDGSSPLFPSPMGHPMLGGQLWTPDARPPLSILSQELLGNPITQKADMDLSTSYTSPASFMSLDFASSVIGLFPDFTAYDTAALAAETAILVLPPHLSSITPRDQIHIYSSAHSQHSDISRSNGPEHSMLDIIDAFPRVDSLEP